MNKNSIFSLVFLVLFVTSGAILHFNKSENTAPAQDLASSSKASLPITVLPDAKNENAFYDANLMGSQSGSSKGRPNAITDLTKEQVKAKQLDHQKPSVDNGDIEKGKRHLVDVDSHEDDKPATLKLWDLSDVQSVTVNDIPAIQTHFSPVTIQQLSVGQSLSFTLPGDAGALTSTLNHSTNPVPGVSVYEGRVDIAGASGDMIVSKGEIETQFIITTPATVYTVSVDNATGKTLIIDQAEYNSRILPIDDTAKLQPSELLPPPS